MVGEKVCLTNDEAHGKDVPQGEDGARGEDVSPGMDSGWGEGGFGEMMGPKEKTFLREKMGLGKKMCLQGWTFCGGKYGLRRRCVPKEKIGPGRRCGRGLNVGSGTIP